MLVVWQFGSSMVLFLAGLKQIPAELYEAAMVDGAGKLRMFRQITIPLLTPIILFNLVMQTINALQEFTAAFVVTNGGPLKATYLLGLKIYDEAFMNMKMGYASALSWFLFAIILLLTLLIFRSARSWVHYEDGGKN
jgi:oligogalacturonide transport system permease protein